MKKIMSDLNKQLILGITLIVTLSVLFIGVLFLTQYKNVTLKKAEIDLQNRALEFVEIGILMQSPNHQRPRDTYFEIIRNVMGNELTIIDRKGNNLVATNLVNNNQVNALNQKYINVNKTEITYDYSDLLKNKTISVIEPIKVDGNFMGVVFLHQNVNEIYSSYISLIYLLIFSVFISLIISIILAILYAKRFVKPIETITLVAKRLKKGEYEAKVNMQRSDQLGELADTLDQMSEGIDSSIKEIKELELLAKELVANVSHEFKTPLTLIRGYAYSLKDKTIKPSNEIYDKIINNTVELEKLVNNLLDLNNYQNGNYNLKLEEFDLCELITNTTSDMKLISKNKNITFEINLDENYIINADYSKIRQLLIIILDNAIKYGKSDSLIKIKLSESLLSINNFGTVIQKKEIDKIFNRYYKVSSEEVGNGLGLCIAKFITEIHNYKLEINSDEINGTTVLINFTNTQG